MPPPSSTRSRGRPWSAGRGRDGGTASVDPVLREVAAHGVSVLRVEAASRRPPPEVAEELAGDEHLLARLVAAAVIEHGADPTWSSVATGRWIGGPERSRPSWPTSSVPPRPSGWCALSIGADPEADLVAERRLDAGWRERLRVPLPAVCSVEGAGVRLRRAPLEGALAASDLPVPVLRTPFPTWSGRSPGRTVRTECRGPFDPAPGWFRRRRQPTRACACWR